MWEPKIPATRKVQKRVVSTWMGEINVHFTRLSDLHTLKLSHFIIRCSRCRCKVRKLQCIWVLYNLFFSFFPFTVLVSFSSALTVTSQKHLLLFNTHSHFSNENRIYTQWNTCCSETSFRHYFPCELSVICCYLQWLLIWLYIAVNVLFVLRFLFWIYIHHHNKL